MTLFETKVWRTKHTALEKCINMTGKQVLFDGDGDGEKIKDYVITLLPCDEHEVEKAYLTLVLFDPTKEKSERIYFCTSTYTICKCEDKYVCNFDKPMFDEREYFA